MIIFFQPFVQHTNKDINQDRFVVVFFAQKKFFSTKQYLNSKNLKNTGVKRKEYIDNIFYIILKKVEDILVEMISTFLLMKNLMQD